MAINIKQLALIKLMRQNLKNSNGIHIKTLSALFQENYQTSQELSNKTGLKEKTMKQLLNQFEQKSIIKKEGILYRTTKIDEIWKKIR